VILIAGPWKDIGAPLVTTMRVGNIDPHFYYDNSTESQYLVWKEDGNDPAHWEPETPIWAQQITNHLDLVGNRTILLENDNKTWEGGLVEGPWIEKIGECYYLFYSANVYDTPRYAIGVARASSVLGPYTKSPRNPLLSSNDNWSGPGHCSVLGAQNNPGGPYFLLYHAWVAGQVGSGYPRVLMMDSFAIDSDGWPQMTDSSAPTKSVQPVPTS
jgi:arabinan endo-1,5-alpha-L-arabinosidase